MKKLIVYIGAISLSIAAIVGCGVLRRSAGFSEKTTSEKKSYSFLIDRNYVRKEFVDTLKLYYDDGPYTYGPTIEINDTCWVYSIAKSTRYFDGADVTDWYTYYIPLVGGPIMYRQNRFSGKGYHGGHIVILKNTTDTSYDYLAEDYFNGGRLARNKKDDVYALGFEEYVANQMK